MLCKPTKAKNCSKNMRVERTKQLPGENQSNINKIYKAHINCCIPVPLCKIHLYASDVRLSSSHYRHHHYVSVLFFWQNEKKTTTCEYKTTSRHRWFGLAGQIQERKKNRTVCAQNRMTYSAEKEMQYIQTLCVSRSIKSTNQTINTRKGYELRNRMRKKLKTKLE